MRFFDIEEGNGGIEIDGQDIRDITLGILTTKHILYCFIEQ